MLNNQLRIKYDPNNNCTNYLDYMDSLNFNSLYKTKEEVLKSAQLQNVSQKELLYESFSLDMISMLFNCFLFVLFIYTEYKICNYLLKFFNIDNMLIGTMLNMIFLLLVSVTFLYSRYEIIDKLIKKLGFIKKIKIKYGKMSKVTYEMHELGRFMYSDAVQQFKNIYEIKINELNNDLIQYELVQIYHQILSAVINKKLTHYDKLEMISKEYYRCIQSLAGKNYAQAFIIILEFENLRREILQQINS